MQKPIFPTSMLFIYCLIFAVPVAAGEQWRTVNYPAKPVEIIVPFAPGGGLDTATRLVARYAENELGQRINVVNPTGGGNIRGNMTGIQAAPDGYVLGAWGNGLVTDEFLIRNTPYTYKSVQPLCMFAEDPNVIAISLEFAAERNIRTLDELLAFARDNPGRVTIGMGGNWTPHDFLRLKMEEMAGVKFNCMAFLGGAPALQSALDGNCDVVTPFLPEILPALSTGKILPLAAAHPRRLPQLPDVPTTAELGYPDMVQSIWRVLTVPVNTPGDIVKYLESVFERTLKDPEFIIAAETAGVTPSFKGTTDLGVFLEQQHEYFAEKTREWGVRLEQ